MSGREDQGERSEKEYEVGYGKPPKSSQFKPGESGNPKGRKRKPKSVAAQLRAILAKKVTITEGGKVKRLPLQQVMLQNIANTAAKGDLKAVAFVLNALNSVEANDTDLLDPNVLSPEDQALLEGMLAELSEPEAEDADKHSSTSTEQESPTNET